ncbi:MAG: (2Fe-2S)-binding protein [Sandaracinobacteroides sp.]
MQVNLTVNGTVRTLEVSERTLLVHALRDHLRLTGAHIGCDTSQCGACTVHMDGVAVKSCAVLAVQADGAEVLTVEGLADGQTLHPMQEAFSAHHALQCGYCTPGMIMAGIDIVRRHGVPDTDTIRAELVGNLCRCTGYHNIVHAIAAGAKAMEAAR